MSKPVLRVRITTARRKRAVLPALFDTGSFYTFVRQDCLPSRTPVLTYTTPKPFQTAGRKGGVSAIGETSLEVDIGPKRILTTALVSPNLQRELLIGAGTMQMWDISVRNRNGSTRVMVGRDMRDPDVTEVA